MKRIPLFLFLTLFSMASQAQSVLIRDVTIHDGAGSVIPDGSIGLYGSKITYVGPTTGLMRTDTFSRVIEGKGQHAYPGFIAMVTRLGLEEIESVRSTLDFAEVGQYNPHVRSLIAYNTDSDVIPTVKSNGILMAQVCPQGGATITGRSSVMTTESFGNYEDRVVAADNGMHLVWPNRFQFNGWWAEPGDISKADNYQKRLNEIENYFAESKAYCTGTVVEKNLRFEAMRDIFSRKAILFIHTNDAKSILEAIAFSQKHNIRIAIAGGTDAWMVTEQLKKANVAVVLNASHSLPTRNDDDIDMPYKTPAILQRAGVTFCLSLDGSWQQRNLPYQAGQAIGYGLGEEAAVSSITLNAAKALGIDQTTGSLEKGKDATLILSTGNMLDMRTSNVTTAFIRGVEQNLDDKQKALYRQYKEKFGF